MDQPKQDIKWFELFFDIIFVVGISKIISEVSYNLESMNFNSWIKVILMYLILFNVWIRTVMLENKVKIVERITMTKVTNSSYMIPIFMQFILTIYLIYFFKFDMSKTIEIFLLVYALLTFLSSFVFGFKYYKTIVIFIILFLCRYEVFSQYILILFAIYMIYESFFTYKKLRTNSNSIFRNNFISKSFDGILERDSNNEIKYNDFRLKLYMPHIIERLGIIMIVFMAEYVIITINVLTDISIIQLFIYSSLMISLLLMFYVNFYSSLEHIDEKLLEINDKKRKYLIGKKTIYVSMFYFLSISCMSFFIKNILDATQLTLLFGASSILLFELSDLTLFEMFNDIKKEKHLKYVLIKVISCLVCLFSAIFDSSIIVLCTLNLCFIINIHAGVKFTTIDYKIY